MTAAAFATLAFNNLSGIGSGAGVLKVDGKAVATQKMEHATADEIAAQLKVAAEKQGWI
jgi:hypothetical protein